MKVLVVDDEKIIRRTVRRTLKGNNFLEAESKTSALKILEENSDVNVVVSDLSMSRKLGGLELAEELGDKRPPFVLMSGHFLEGVREKAEEIGLVILEKPFTPPGLRTAVEEAVCANIDRATS
ncbi:MAG: response regulator [Parcubacteria group bacterium]|nr:response regulator [Parcubacteria group bacterium]